MSTSESSSPPSASSPADPALERAILSAARTPLPVDVWPGIALRALHVRIEADGRSGAFDAVLAKRPGQLSLRGLDAAGAESFALVLRAGGGEAGPLPRVELRGAGAEALPVPPEVLITDLQRVFYPWLLGVPVCGDCERSGWRGQVAIWERLRAGRLLERRFAFAGAIDRGSIAVRYVDPPEVRDAAAPPARIELENGWLGHRIVLETRATRPGLDVAPAD